jgi:hypothetical protein
VNFETIWPYAIAVVGYVGGLFTVGFKHWVQDWVAYRAEQRKRRDEEIRGAIEVVHPALMLMHARIAGACKRNDDSLWPGCLLATRDFLRVYVERGLIIGPEIRRAIRPVNNILSAAPPFGDPAVEVEFIKQNGERFRKALHRALRATVAIRERH